MQSQSGKQKQEKQRRSQVNYPFSSSLTSLGKEKKTQGKIKGKIKNQRKRMIMPGEFF